MTQAAFHPSNKLEQVLVSACANPSERPEFYRQLLQSELFLLTPDAPDREGHQTLKAATNVSFVNLNGTNGAFLPIFTSQNRLQEFVNQLGQKYGFLALRGSDLFPILTQHPQPAVLNPGGAYGKELTPDEISRIASGSILKTEGQVIAEATQILIGQPATYPQELVAALTRLFQKHENVQAAYLAQIHNPSSGEKPHVMIGIEAAGDFRTIVGEAAMVAQGVSQKDEIVDFIQVGGPQGSLDSYFKKQTTPFYQTSAKKPFWKVW
jgi:hypothetical protein